MASHTDYQQIVYSYRRSPDQDAGKRRRHPVIVVGAGPVGLSLAIDLALQGVPVVLLDNDDRLSTGSRAICFAKRTLEIFDRLGCGDRMVDKGVSWNTGKVFFHGELLYQFHLLKEEGHERPAFINLQQYYVEGFLVERAEELPLIDLRWKNAVTELTQDHDRVLLSIDTPDGPYQVEADYVVACDGPRSTIRKAMGLESKGEVIHDRFLIADVKMKAPFPSERWFWFDPPFHDRNVLLHKQPDDVWRIDFQLGWNADPDIEKKPENILPRVRALLGPDVPFELEWASVYTFASLRMESFCHGRVLFAGDSAHGVSPFGARGANSGIQDAENAAWKLAHVIAGRATAKLLASYGTEREYAADENLKHSARSAEFISPKNEVSHAFRQATLALARDYPFARALVNSGRLSTATIYRDSPLNTPDADVFNSPLVPGAPAADGPVLDGEGTRWLLRALGGGAFVAVVFDGPETTALVNSLDEAASEVAPLRVIVITREAGGAGMRNAQVLVDVNGVIERRYDARPGTTYLLRPDQHVCARWRYPDIHAIRGAIRRALAFS